MPWTFGKTRQGPQRPSQPPALSHTPAATAGGKGTGRARGSGISKGCNPLPSAVRLAHGEEKAAGLPGGAAVFGGRGPLAPRPAKPKAGACGPRLWLSKKWLAPLFRGFHSSLAPTARPGSYAEKPLLRKAFCGFAVHAAKSDYSLRGLRPPNPQGFFDRLRRGPAAPAFVRAVRTRRPPPGPQRFHTKGAANPKDGLFPETAR